MKICKSCLKELALEDFTPSKVTKDGREGKCRTCRSNQRKTYTKNCGHCSSEFITHKRETVFCSQICVGQSKIINIERECPTCKSVFDVKRYRAKAENIYCTKECWTKSLSTSMIGAKNRNYSRVKVSCFTCKNEMNVQRSRQITAKYHFCSKKCYLSGIGATRAGKLSANYKRVECTCAECGESFERKPSQIKGGTYCSNECRIKTLERGEISLRSSRLVVECFNCEKEIYRSSSRLSKSSAHYCTLKCKDIHYAKTFRSGENAYNYNSNKSLEERMRERNYPEYRIWRTCVYSRDKYTCVSCKDSKGGNLIAHHLFSYAKNPTLRTDLDNGVTLCTRCHSDFHSRFGYYNNTEEQFKVFKESRIS